jgi:hypothetical protein
MSFPEIESLSRRLLTISNQRSPFIIPHRPMATPPRLFAKPILELSMAKLPQPFSPTTLSPRAQALWNNASMHAGPYATRIIPIPFSVIGKVFGIDNGAVRAQGHKEYRNTVLHAGRPLVLSETQIDDLVAVILEAFHNRHPLTLAEICAII